MFFVVSVSSNTSGDSYEEKNVFLLRYVHDGGTNHFPLEPVPHLNLEAAQTCTCLVTMLPLPDAGLQIKTNFV